MKKFWKIFGFCLLGVLGVLALTSCTLKEKIKGWLDIPSENEPSDVPTTTTPSIDGEITQTTQKLGLKRMIQAKDDKDVLTLIATPNVDGSFDTKLNWIATWFDGDNQGDPLDYINMEVSEDTLSCDVSVKQAFKNQIIITVYLESDPSVKATASVDYLKRTTDLVVGDIFNFEDGGLQANVNGQAITFASEITYKDLMGSDIPLMLNRIVVDEETLIGSLATTQTYQYEITWTDEVATALKSAYLENGMIDSESDFVNVLFDEGTILDTLNYYIDSLNGDSQSITYNVLANYSVWFNIKVVATDTYNGGVVNTYTETFTLGGFNVSDGKITDITLNDTQLIF